MKGANRAKMGGGGGDGQRGRVLVGMVLAPCESSRWLIGVVIVSGFFGVRYKVPKNPQLILVAKKTLPNELLSLNKKSRGSFATCF